MKIFGDYHTHTYFSDGRGGIGENIAAASRRGLEAVAISDHGFNNPRAFSLTRKKAAKQAKIIEKERSRYHDLRIYHAIEADIIGTDGETDMRSGDLEAFDFMLAGFHRFAKPKNAGAFFDMYVPAYVHKIIRPSKSVIKRNTLAFCRMIRRFPVAVVAHINDMVITDVKEVAMAAADYGVYLEINMKHLAVMRRALDGIMATNVKLLANTDAHTPEYVGDFSALDAFVKECPEIVPRIANAVPGEIKFRKSI